MKTIVIDPGHGGSDTGATYQGYQEKEFNLSIALKVQNHLLKNYEVDVIMTRTSDITMSLDERTQLANAENADFFLSIHNNAAGGSGFESYIYSGTVPSITKKHQNIIHNTVIDAIAAKYNVKDRGEKRANFHVLRETVMSAVLLEVLFIDDPRNLDLLKNSAFIKDVSTAIAEGVGKALDLPVKTLPGILYKVIAGSFKIRSNAEKRVQFLADQGFDSFITPAKVSGEQFYRVQAGAFAFKQNAEKQVEKLKSIGITDAFYITEGTMAPIPGENYNIQGEIHLPACQLDNFAKTVNPDTPQLGNYYLKYGKTYGIRADVAYAQAIHETDFFRFTGIVDKNQNNYAGIGATGPDNPGASFQTPENGVHAHIQHLFAYASKKDIPDGYPKIDPRFDLVTRGSATTWIQLNGKWAVPGTTYGQQILDVYRRMIKHTIEAIQTQKTELDNVLRDI